jgi:CoA:oxalate CoA-transferase
VRTAGNPIKMPAYPDIDANVALRAPALNQHREAILQELMAATQAYAPTVHGAAEPEDQDAQAMLARLVS